MPVSPPEETAAVVHSASLRNPLPGLTPLLPLRKRRRLASAILRDVLEAAAGTRVARPVLVAPAEDAVREAAREADVPFRPARAGEGSAEATARCGRDLAAEGFRVAALVRADLPLLRSEDLAFLLGRAARGPRVVLLEGRSDRASGAVLHPLAPYAPLFGTDAPERFRKEAERRGMALERYRLMAGLPLVGEGDLPRVYHDARQSRAKALLKAWGGASLWREGAD